MSLNVAFVGLKGHWQGIAEELSLLPEARCVAAVDDDPGQLARVQDVPGITSDTHAYLTYREMLEKEVPDIVVEAGNDRDRAEILIACAERGINLIAEKPLAKDLAELDRVHAAVKRNNVFATMLLTMRTTPAYLAMRQAVQEGLVGDICQAGGQKSYKLGERPAWQKSRDTFSGIIPFVGIHAMDLIRWVSGREFMEVMAYASNIGHPQAGDMEDTACVIARLDNDASAAVRLDYCRPGAAPTHGDDRLRLAGGKGVIESIGERVTLVTEGEGPRELPLPEPVRFFADYLDALAQQREPLVPFADCVRMTEVVLRARESAEMGHPIRL